MIAKLIGKTSVLSGEWEGRPWTHKKLFVTYPKPEFRELTGDFMEILKVPIHVDIPGNPGDMIDVHFTRYNKVDRVTVVEEV